MDGCCRDCGRYGQELAALADGTKIYRCFDCGRVWGERLVIFDVSFALAEHKAANGQEAEATTDVLVENASTA